VYEGEQEGANIVAQNLLGKAIRTQFVKYYPNPKPEKSNKQQAAPKTSNPYKTITDWFGEGHTLDLLLNAPDKEYRKALDQVPGLKEFVKKKQPDLNPLEMYFMMEFVLHGLAEYSMLSKKGLSTGTRFGDLLSSMFSMPGMDTLEEEDEDEDF
jgi:magnesium chelatase subunit I